MKKKQKEQDIQISSELAANIEKTSVTNFLKDNYIPYAYYVIRSRALTQAAEGLKPVQRRILYLMWKEGIKSNKGTIKNQRIAGNVSGTLHPHGDSSVADAMAVLAQTFNMRVPLLDVQGSTGITWGSEPASPRYLESRLSKAGEELVREVDENAVPLVNNYDDTAQEPMILPARFPNAICNGSDGIAVGYASSMYSHNPDEAMDACIAFAKNPKLTIDELMEIMPGPDLPTGGELIGLEGVRDYYETGRGTFIIRGRYKIEELKRGRHNIVFYELPYGVSPERVITQIQKLQDERKKFKEISEVKNLTDKRQGLKLAITVKAGADPRLVAEQLFKDTECEASLSVNATTLVDSKPVQLGMLDLIKNFIEFRYECIKNKTNFRLEKLQAEAVKLDAIMKVLLDIDKCIDIIRNSNNPQSAKNNLKREFKLTDDQATYILSLRLQTLTKSERRDIEIELNDNKAQIKELEKLLSSDKLLQKQVIKELEETKKIISDPRRTIITDMSFQDHKDLRKDAIKQIEKAEEEVPNFITRNEQGNLLRRTTKPNHEDYWEVPSVSNLIGLTTSGSFVEIPVLSLPIRGNGFEPDSDIIAIGLNRTGDSEKGFLIVTSSGGVNIVDKDLKGMPAAVNLKDGEKVIYGAWLSNEDFENKDLIMLENSDGKLLRTPIKDIRSTAAGAGTVAGMKSKEGEIVDAVIIGEEDKLIYFWNDVNEKLVETSDIPVQGRGGMGSRISAMRKGHKWLTNLKLVSEEEAKKNKWKVSGRGQPADVKKKKK